MYISIHLHVGDGQGGLVCWSPWVCKVSDTTEQLNWLTDIHMYIYIHMHTKNKAFTVKISRDFGIDYYCSIAYAFWLITAYE